MTPWKKRDQQPGPHNARRYRVWNTNASERGNWTPIALNFEGMQIIYDVSEEERDAIIDRVELLDAALENGPGVSHILTILDYGLEQGKPFVVWEYPRGSNLHDQWISAKKTMTLDQVRDFLRQAASALKVLHTRHLAHLALFPLTIMNIGGEEAPHYVVGNAHIPGAHVENYDGNVLTLYNLAPEMFDAQSKPGAPADVYMLGVILCWLMTGQGPFAREETQPARIREQHLYETPICAGVRQQLKSVVQKALAKEPEDRFQTVQELYEAFENACLLIEQSRSHGNTSFDAIKELLVMIEYVIKGKPTRRTVLALMALIAMFVISIALYETLRQVSSVRIRGKNGPPEGSSQTAQATRTFLIPAAAMATSGDGRMILAGSPHGVVTVMDSRTGDISLDDPTRHAGTHIIAAVWGPHDKAFAILDAAGKLSLWSWSWDSGQYAPFAEKQFPEAIALAWSEEDTLLVASGKSILTYRSVMESVFEEPGITFKGHNSPVNCVVITPDGKRATSGGSQAARLWTIATGATIDVFHGNAEKVLALAFDESGQMLAIGNEAGLVQVRSTEDENTGSLIGTYIHSAAVRSIAFARDRSLAFGLDDGTLYYASRITDEKPILLVKEHEPIEAIAWIPPGLYGEDKYLVYSTQGNIRILHVLT